MHWECFAWFPVSKAVPRNTSGALTSSAIALTACNVTLLSFPFASRIEYLMLSFRHKSATYYGINMYKCRFMAYIHTQICFLCRFECSVDFNILVHSQRTTFWMLTFLMLFFCKITFISTQRVSEGSVELSVEGQMMPYQEAVPEVAQDCYDASWIQDTTRHKTRLPGEYSASSHCGIVCKITE